MNFGGTLRLNKFACFSLTFILLLLLYWRAGGTNYPADKNDLIDLKSLLKASILAAERGGKKVAEGRDLVLNTKSKGKTLEGANDPVTNVDLSSHCAMYYGLKNTFPKLAVVSEEHTSSKCEDQPALDVDAVLPDHTAIDYMMDEHVYTKDVTIWIDPLDATVEYTEGLYEYVTTMVCVAINGVPIIGVIHFPFSHQTYWAWSTKKTSDNIRNVPHKEESKDAPRVVISRSHPGKVADLAKQAFGPKATISQAAGAGYKVMKVANGTYDVYFHATAIKKWDICAGDALIKAIDGKMTTIKGKYVDYTFDSDVKVTDGILVTRYDHDYYLSKASNVMNGM